MIAKRHHYLPHPIALQNNTETPGPFGSLGLMSSGIEIYVPLSPFLTLAMWCSSILIDTLTRHVDGSVFAEARIQRYKKNAAAERLLNSFNAQTPYPLDEEQVVNLNRRQLQSAERFIFSEKSDFRDARELLQKTPGLRAGRRMAFG